MEVPGLAVVLGVVAITLGLMATVLTQVQTTQTSGTAAYNITQQGINAQASLAGWQGTWVVIIAAAIVIGIVGAYLMFRPRA